MKRGRPRVHNRDRSHLINAQFLNKNMILSPQFIKSIFQRVSQKGHDRSCETGQVIILVVVTLGGMLLSAASMSGILLLYQIRNTNDAVNSAKAIFAADAGIEAASFCLFSSRGNGCDPKAIAEGITFEDPNVNIELNLISSPSLITIESRGFASKGKIIRTLEAFFSP